MRHMIDNPTQPEPASIPEAPAPDQVVSSPPPATTGAASFSVHSRGSLRPIRRPARRTRVVIREIGPWSVLKFSLIFYFCVMLILFFALVIIYLILSAAGAMNSLERVLGYVFGNGTSTYGPQKINIDGGVLFTYIFLAGCVLVVVWSLITVFIAFLYNLISDIVGGIEITLADRSPR